MEDPPIIPKIGRFIEVTRFVGLPQNPVDNSYPFTTEKLWLDSERITKVEIATPSANRVGQPLRSKITTLDGLHDLTNTVEDILLTTAGVFGVTVNAG